MFKVFYRALAIAGVLALGVACNSESTPPPAAEKAETGSLQLALVGVGQSGAAYQLHGEFSIHNFDTGVITEASTEDDPGAPFIIKDVSAGTYGVFLKPGYSVNQISSSSGPTSVEILKARREAHRGVRPAPRRPGSSTPILVGVSSDAGTISVGSSDAGAVYPGVVDGGVTASDAGVSGGTGGEPIPAALISDNPATVSVEVDEFAFVDFVFVVGDDVVNMQKGTLAITAQFIESEGPVGNCCESTSAAGCADEAVEECVCDLDPYCCEVAFDELCVSEAQSCDAECPIPPPENDCCSTSGAPGCNEPEVMECVCDTDSYCCTTGFDEQCVSTAATSCNSGCLIEEASNCCAPSAIGGCTDTAVNECVCDLDSACCTDAFGPGCVELAQTSCGASCVEQSDCCGSSTLPGCSEPTVEACVCDLDPFCCGASFDPSCADLAVNSCGATCPGQ